MMTEMKTDSKQEETERKMEQVREGETGREVEGVK